MKTIIYGNHKTDFCQVLIGTIDNQLSHVIIGKHYLGGSYLVDQFLWGKYTDKVEYEFDFYNNIIDSELTRKVLSAVSGNLEVIDYNISGTEFQRKVWSAIGRIPFGKTTSYKQLAEEIGHPKAYRAVGSACANNPLAVIIPCHRVLPADGTIGSYAWGVDLKQKLLEREGLKVKFKKDKYFGLNMNQRAMKEITDQEDKIVFSMIKKTTNI